MDCAPLNLVLNKLKKKKIFVIIFVFNLQAHFHERRAEKLVKRHRYDDAYKAIETSLLYVENAYKNVRLPKALEILNTQKWDYERKLNQIHMRRQQYEKIKSKEIVPSLQIETTSNNLKSDVVNAQSIDKTIKEFNDKYGSTLLDSSNKRLIPQQNEHTGNKLFNDKSTKVNDKRSETSMGSLENNIKRLSILDDTLHKNDDELPSLAPLELPSFDYSVFGAASDLVENFQK